MVALSFALHSTIMLHLSSGQGFLLEHSQLWSSSLPSPQDVSSLLTAVPPWVCSPNPMFQHTAPVPTSGHPSQAGVHRAVARTICVGLTLSCLPQTCCWALLQTPEDPLLSQLISPPVRGLTQMQEHLLTFSSPPGVQVLSCFLSSFFPFFLSSYPVMWGPFLIFQFLALLTCFSL